MLVSASAVSNDRIMSASPVTGAGAEQGILCAAGPWWVMRLALALAIGNDTAAGTHRWPGGG